MKYLVTGGAGFIGSHLADSLLKNGDSVIVIDNLSTGRLENIQHNLSKDKFEFVEGDILNSNLMDKFCKKVDAIIHLAAAVGVELIVKKPLESLITNIKGSEVVLEAALRYRKKILVASTSEIYGKNTQGPLKEDDDRILGSPLKTRWSYSTAKAVDEILAYLYWKEKQLPSIIVRLFNTVGPRQSPAYGMVIPRFIKQALANEPITVYGTGKQTRCFTHVKDVVKALIDLINCDASIGKVFNIGSQQEVSIEELAKKVIRITKSTSKINYISYDKAYEDGFEDMQRRVPDISKINKIIKFSPNFDLGKIIKDIVDFDKQSVIK